MSSGLEEGKVGLEGQLGFTVTRGKPAKENLVPKLSTPETDRIARQAETDRLKALKIQSAKEIKRYLRRWHLQNWLKYRWKEIPFYLFLFCLLPVLRFFIPAITVVHSKLSIKRTRFNWETHEDEILDYGIVGRHLVVTAGKNYVASTFDNTAEPENLKFHAFGLGTSGPAAGDTLMGNECTTEYATDNVRPTGTQAHSTNTYTTVGTFAPDSAGSATIPVTEWGLFSVATVNTITLFDRQVFSAINLAPAADTLATTYVLTLS